MNTKEVFFVGDVSWDTTVVVDHVPEPDEKVVTRILIEDVGGVVTNAAIACSLAGTEVTLVCGIASDAAGAAALGALEEQDLCVLSNSSPSPTTRAIITLDAKGEKRLVLFPGGRMYPSKELVESFDLEHARWVHTALYDLDIARVLIERCRGGGIDWSIDLETATIPPHFEMIADLLNGCHTIFVNARAAAQMGPKMVQTLLDAGVKEVIETLGSNGARWNGYGETLHVPTALSLPVVDTTGAGDALAGWYISEQLLGHQSVEALTVAVTAASYSVSRIGVVSSYPRRSDLQLPRIGRSQ